MIEKIGRNGKFYHVSFKKWKIVFSCLLFLTFLKAIELFKQSEKKFAFLSLSRAFMEKFHQSLRKLRQQIKSEVQTLLKFVIVIFFYTYEEILAEFIVDKYYMIFLCWFKMCFLSLST